MKALFAVVCFILFYAISAAAVVGLTALGYTLFSNLLAIRNVRGLVLIALAALASFIAAGIIVWSVLPRIDRFAPPGPELFAEQQPELFAEIRMVADAAQQKMPDHVYLVLDCNAFVTERGGLMGIGSRRVMGIGLALLSHFDTDEVRAVIAHELGHFDGGDTKLGPWVYKTRSAMGRTVTNLYETAGSLAEHSTVMGVVLMVVAAPFKWMAAGYLRVAQAVSRQQEYSADALAARIVGTSPLVSGFEKLLGASVATEAYLEQEILPLVELRIAPPFFSGLTSFRNKHRDVLEKIDRDTLKLGEADAYDSHPPLSARIEALRRLPSAEPVLAPRGDAKPAMMLLAEPEALARVALEFHAKGSLKVVSWDDTGTHLIAAQRERIAHFLPWLRGRPVGQLRWDRATHTALISLLPEGAAALDELPDDLVHDVAESIFTQALQVALADAGYAARSAPGEPIVMVRDDTTIDVSKQVTRLKDGELDAGSWIEFWKAAGLGDHPWGEKKKAPRRERDE